MKKALSVLLLLVVIVAVLSGCETNPMKSTMKDQYKTVAEQAVKFQENQPAPIIEFSNTRDAVIKRIERWNDPNKISYIYLVSFGRVMAFYTIKGSVESKRSYLYPVTAPYNSDYSESSVIDNPDVDGTYGDNSDSVFFFTTDDVYVEWKGDYMWVDQPLKFQTAPELYYELPNP